MKIGYFERIRCPEKEGVSIGKIEIRLPRLEKKYSYINDFYFLMGERVLKKGILHLEKAGGGEIKLDFSVPKEKLTENLIFIERRLSLKEKDSEKSYVFSDCFDTEKKIIIS